MDRQEVLIVLLLGHPILEEHDSNLERFVVLEAGGLYVDGIEIRGKSLFLSLQPRHCIFLLSCLLLFTHGHM